MIKQGLVALLLLFTPVTALANSCGAGSAPKTEFLEQMSTKYKIYTLTKEAQERFIAYVNPIRINNGAEAFNKDAQFYFAAVEVNSTGVVWFEKGCIVRGSVLQLSSAELAKAMQLAGIKQEDFVAYVKGDNV